MNALPITDDLFFNQTELNQEKIDKIVSETLAKVDDGELFLEHCQSESMIFDDGQLKSASFDTSQGFGLRAIAGDSTGYAHSTNLTEKSIKKAAETVKAVANGYSGALSPESLQKTNHQLYHPSNPLLTLPFNDKVSLLKNIDTFARNLDPRVSQVIISLSGEWQAVQIMRPNGEKLADIRPLVRLNISIGNIKCEIISSWLNPTKERKLLIVGSKKMLEFNEMENNHKLKIFNKYAFYPKITKFKKNYISDKARIYTGKTKNIKVRETDTLKNELLYFEKVSKKNITPITSGKFCLEVLKLII